jgi:hypothetical protein
LRPSVLREREDQEIIHAIAFYEVVLRDQRESRLCSFFDHHVVIHAVIVAFSVANRQSSRYGIYPALCRNARLS